MRTLIFGASGYVGRHVVERLAADGDEVAGVVRDQRGAAIVAAHGGQGLLGSIDDERFLMRAFERAERIVWAAQLMLDEESDFIQRALRLLEGSGKTFVFTGGTSLLSEFTAGAWSEASFAEDEPFVPRRQIAARLDTENAVRAASGAGLRTLCLRPPLIWGGGRIKVISDLYHSARVTGTVCYVGSGLACYSGVHVADLAELYALALARGVSGALYHGVSGEVNYRQMADTVARHLGVPTSSVSLEQAEQIWDRFTALIVFGSCSRSRSPRARRELGWAPSPERLDLLRECVDPIYAAADERRLSSWVRSPAV